MGAADELSETSACPSERPLVIGAARGISFGAVSDERVAQVQRWVTTGIVEGGEAIEPPLVYRSGDLFVKFIERSYSRMPLRTSRALRTARHHARLHWVPVPAPVLALDLPRAAPHEGLLVTRFIEGEHLGEMRYDERALEEFAKFLARAHARGVHHGDLHPRNLQWDGTRWFLLDLDGVRSPAHLVVAARLSLRQWGRLIMNLASTGPDDLLAEPFRIYMNERPELGDHDRAWARVQRFAAAMARQRAK